MRIISTFTNRTESLVTGTLDQQRQAERERQAAEVAHLDNLEQECGYGRDLSREWRKHRTTA